MARKIKGRNAPQSEGTMTRAAVSKRHPMFGALKGLVRIAPGTDITAPADPDWADLSAAAMTLDEFKRSLSETEPTASSSPALAALWWAAKGDWGRAHALVMDEEGGNCAWVHAYLHRVEGDLDNAGYWYRQAGKAVPQGTLQSEWVAIADALLGDM
jgi:hypothetical protein